ncbi:TonB-dependent receptor [Paracoccus methylarcula]|uniref:TonB-dependent receptor n=1 Tax=Paracoccus methylarcula TaxID=72022 RepID=A0A3R7SD90_9RHOB|nr:TonB-dependent receptor [Paracoccus methylarcula]RNF35308.1 TonB-dependent receptor [Paracoccus methylarcula]
MRTRSFAGMLLGSVALITPFAAQAQQDVIVLEPIILEGEKLLRSISDTASSVSALSAEDIASDVGASSVAEAINGMPNVVFPDTVSAPIIRGQDTQGPNSGAGAFFGGTVPRAKTNVDGHYLSYNETVFGVASIWDVDAIEVFRGPQTIAQGANSIAGAIIVNTKDPSFTPEGAARLQYGTGGSRRASVAYSAPLGQDLAARISLDHAGRDGFIDYVNPGFQKGETDQDFAASEARFKLLWQPQAAPGLEAMLTFSHKQSNRPTSEAAGLPYDDLESTSLGMPSWDQRVNTTIADVSYEFSNGMQLSNQTQFSDQSIHRLAAPAENGEAFIDSKEISNETRLTFGGEDSRFSGVVGLFYAKTESDELLYTRGVSEFEDTKENLGVFSELTWRPDDRWTVSAGLRYQRDSIERSGTSSLAREELDYDRSFDAWLPKISVAYDVSPDVTVGALVSKGYNPGGVNLSFVQGRYFNFDAERATNYELFGRADLIDGRMRLTGNLFYTRFSDSQRVLPEYLDGLPRGNIVVNADDAKAYGLDLTMDYAVNDTLRVKAGLGLLHSEIGEFTDAAGVNYEGNKFGRTPDHTISLGMEWQVTDKTTVAADVSHIGGYYSTDWNRASYEVDSYTIANARVDHALNDKVNLYAYVENIFDERAPTYKYDDRQIGGIIASMTKPREVGLGLDLRF